MLYINFSDVAFSFSNVLLSFSNMTLVSDELYAARRKNTSLNRKLRYLYGDSLRLFTLRVAIKPNASIT